jgi:deoxyribodipyrimidine photo-lyase
MATMAGATSFIPNVLTLSRIHFPTANASRRNRYQHATVYNPIKKSYEHDPGEEFIRKWVPELQNIPRSFIHEPYKMTYLDQKFNDFEVGVDYPNQLSIWKN